MSAFPRLESSNLITWERVFLPLVMIDVVHGAAVEGWMSECGTVGTLEQMKIFSCCLCVECISLCVLLLGLWVWHAGFSQGKY